MTTLIVAYTSNKKKQKHFFDGLVRTARTWVGRCGPDNTMVSVRLLPLFDHDDACTLSHTLSPNTVHAVIHKRTDDMAAAVAGGDADAARRVAALDHVLNGRLHGHDRERVTVVAIDPLDGVWRLVDRRKISEAVDRAFGPAHIPTAHDLACCPHKERRFYARNVTTVPWAHVPMRTGFAAIRNAILGNLTFPIILKRRLACGTKASHEMVIAYDMDGVIAAAKAVFGADDHSHHPCPNGDDRRHTAAGPDDFATDVIAQEFIANHGGVLFKVYAIGSNIVVQPRASVQHNIKGADGGYYYFDSQKLNRGEHFSFDPATGCSKATEAIMPSRKLIAAVVSDLSKELGLSLIGVDLVYDIHTKYYHVVDINYFPGYKGVGKAYEWILQHICNRVLERLEER